MHRIFRVKAYEMEHGPHFNEEHARKAVMKMENEDGTRGPHWSLEETSAIADVNNNITKMGYESQLSMCNQTNTLQSAITSGFNSLLSDNTTKFNILGSKIDAQTQIINDKFCQLEMREMQNKIDALRQENNQLALSASQQAQTANIVSQLKSPCPVPAYFVPNPNCCPFDYYRYLLNRDNTTTAPAA